MSNFVAQFDGKSAIVTGAGAGIGKAIAEALIDAGANVAVNDMNPDRVETVAQQLNERGNAIGFHGDISNRFQVGSLIERARDAFGRIDFLVNAAGIYKAEPMKGIDEWDWRRILEINTTGTFFCVQLMSRVMADEGGGVMVNIASTAGNGRTLPEGAGYVTSKAGVVALTQQAARELAPDNIRVNAVCPGFIAEPDMPTVDDPTNAMQRSGTPQEVASAVVFLLSDAAQFITGQALHVDGGGY